MDSHKGLFETFRDQKNDPRLRAIALEMLAGIQQTNDEVIRDAIADSAPEVRAIGAEVLVSQLDPQTAPQLWKAIRDPSRLVRLAAAPFLDRVDDESIASDLWPLYQSEADRMDADAGFERTLLDSMVRHRLRLWRITSPPASLTSPRLRWSAAC